MAKRRKIPLPGPLVSGFAAECEAAGMRISKSEATVLSGEKDGEPTLGQERVTAPTGGLQVSQSSCSQVRGEKKSETSRLCGTRRRDERPERKNVHLLPNLLLLTLPVLTKSW